MADKKGLVFGVTLIETIIVVGILAILALFSVETIIEFQRNSLIDASSNELASTLRLARNKSMSGEILEGLTFEDFEEDGLPEYGVSVSADSYLLFRDYQLLGEGSISRETLGTFPLSTNFTLSPTIEVLFGRIDGFSNPTTLTLSVGGEGQQEVVVDTEGVISVRRL